MALRRGQEGRQPPHARGSRVAAAGDSGGGYVAVRGATPALSEACGSLLLRRTHATPRPAQVGACMHLASRGEAGLVRLLLAIAPMTTDLFLRSSGKHRSRTGLERAAGREPPLVADRRWSRTAPRLLRTPQRSLPYKEVLA